MKKYMFFIVLIISTFCIYITLKFTYSNTYYTVKSDYITVKNITVDKNYLLALNAIDQFLGAWLMRDQKRGTEFITDSLKNSLSDNELFAFFVSTSNPHHQGFEVLGYKHINDEKIRFFVWLYEYYTAQNVTPYKRPTPYYVDVVKFNEYIWKVDNLPTPIYF